jgi:exonuclease SbcD
MTEPISAPVRVLHVGDVHLGVELYGRPLPEKGYGTRVADFLASLELALEHARDADLVVFPGDIYKNCEPSPTVQREFATRIRQTAKHAPVVIIPGNHDLPNTWGRASSIDIFRVLEVENVHVFRAPKVEPVRTARGEVLIAPMPFYPRSRLVALEEARGKGIQEVLELMRERLVGYLDELAAEVTEYRKEHGESIPAILMAHYTVQGAVFGGYGKGALLAPEVELPLGAVRNPAFDYVALAHIHKHQGIPANEPTAQPPVVYAGSVDRVDFGEEGEEKVVVLAEVARRNATWRAVPLAPRPFVTLRLQPEDTETLEAAKAALERQQDRIRGAVVRLYYSLPPGQPNLPERELRTALQGAHHVAAIRREMPMQGNRSRLGALTTQLGPLEALEEYLRTKPELAAQHDDLMERAKGLLAEVTAGVDGD